MEWEKLDELSALFDKTVYYHPTLPEPKLRRNGGFGWCADGRLERPRHREAHIRHVVHALLRCLLEATPDECRDSRWRLRRQGGPIRLGVQHIQS